DEEQILYKPEYKHSISNWLTYKPVREVSVTDTSYYLAKIVRDKIRQFQTHFSYLFLESSQAPFKINIINISNDLEVVKGIFQWLVDCLNEGTSSLKPVEVTLYKEESSGSALDSISRVQTVKDFEQQFDVKLKAKDLEPEMILRM